MTQTGTRYVNLNYNVIFLLKKVKMPVFRKKCVYCQKIALPFKKLFNFEEVKRFQTHRAPHVPKRKIANHIKFGAYLTIISGRSSSIPMCSIWIQKVQIWDKDSQLTVALIAFLKSSNIIWYKCDGTATETHSTNYVNDCVVKDIQPIDILLCGLIAL